MKEIWFWISKDLTELVITIIIILIAVGCFGLWFLIDVIKRGFKKK